MSEDRDLTAPVQLGRVGSDVVRLVTPVTDDPTSAAAMALIAQDPLRALGAPGQLGTRSEIEKELDLIAAVIRSWYSQPPDKVMRECGACTARLSELEVLLHRVEAGNRQYTRIRTQQVDRFLAECDRQFKVASRLVEVQRQDIDLSR